MRGMWSDLDVWPWNGASRQSSLLLNEVSGGCLLSSQERKTRGLLETGLSEKKPPPVGGGGLAAEGTNVPLFQFYQSTWSAHAEASDRSRRQTRSSPRAGWCRLLAGVVG